MMVGLVVGTAAALRLLAGSSFARASFEGMSI